MSASPSGQSNGQTPTPNGGPPQYVRKPKAADPLRPRKKPVRRPNLLPGETIPRPNGIRSAGATARSPHGATHVQGAVAYKHSENGGRHANSNGGWTGSTPEVYTDYPLYTTKRALREGLRFHIARFASTKKDVDPSNQDEFTRPVVLHRRDPKQPPPGKGTKNEELAVDEPMDSKEREKQEIAKAEKEAKRAADLAQIAPTGNNASAMAAKKTQPFRNEKTTQVHRVDKTEEQKKASDLRYEEALPWHLEDADNKNTWVGNYEAALSETNVIFLIDDNKFKMIPVEKWYKFTPKGQFKTYTIEEAEAKMSKKTKESRWVMKTNEKEEASQKTKSSGSGLYMVKGESQTLKNAAKTEVQDMDDLDFDGDDLFQDDDEMATVEPDKDEDTKDAQDRIKREQLGANLFNKNDEAEIEAELKEIEKEAEQRKKLGKGVKKALKKRERNLIYESDDSDEDPYREESDDDTSDEEKQKELDRKKDEEAKNKVKAESKLPSGASSKGTNTPSGRPKHTDPLKKKNLKRPGSPNLSESSGNESSRKKAKKHTSSTVPSRTSTPVPGSRPGSPAPSRSQSGGNSSSRNSSIVKLNVNLSKLSDIQSLPPNPSPVHGAMSDGEGTGGEMSDGGKKKQIKIRIKGASPTASRAGSPAPTGSVGGSRAGSPAAQVQGAGGSPPGDGAASPGAGKIQPHELIEAVPVGNEGIAAGTLMKKFNKRVGDGENQTSKAEFIQLVRIHLLYGADKLLRRKP